jgi:gas vesicle protein
MDDREPQVSVGTSLVIFLLGVAVGATAAILYAPASGAETRKQLVDKAGELREKASDISHQVTERAGEWRDKVATRLRHSSDNGDMPMPVEATADGAQG